MWTFRDGMWQLVPVSGGPSATAPPVDPYVPTGGGGGGGDSRGSVGTPTMNLGRPPGLLPFAGYESAGNFTPNPFVPTSWDDAEKEPGFGAAQQRLSKEVQNSAAYQGVLRSGATIGKLDSVLDANRQQNFAQFDARNFRNFQANYTGAKDAFTFRAADVDRKNNYNFNVADRSFQDELSRWQEQVRSLTSLARPVA
jgi:hypothetical protein